ncbi:MAG TPA: helix-hairpin-helix domain-containing protein, partial [Kofleriaceae bacterium]|nr:helix-hairpin-helix domain-containing protein [Kofleriaceae bacterium]
GVATAGAIAIAAASVLAPPPASAQAPARPPADQVSGASGTARDGPITPAGLTGPVAAAPPPSVGAAAPDPCRTRAGPARPIALNSAGRAELEELPGIGPAKAQRILDWRDKHGRFRRIIDLRRVKGFGRKTVLRLAPHLVLDAPAAAPAAVTSPAARPASAPPPAAASR